MQMNDEKSLRNSLVYPVMHFVRNFWSTKNTKNHEEHEGFLGKFPT